MGRPYGLGPRVPMFVISPWSRGGWVDSQVFDHTSVIRFLEKRFGVVEPNISPWRRAVCGDLTSAFDFKTPNKASFERRLPETKSAAARTATLPGRTTPATPPVPGVPMQAHGPRPSRALPYALGITEAVEAETIRLSFHNDGSTGAVFHVYDRRHLDRVPRRYTVSPGRSIDGVWDDADYDLWVLGSNGFHRHFIGDRADQGVGVMVKLEAGSSRLRLLIDNQGPQRRISVSPNAYLDTLQPWRAELAANGSATHQWNLVRSGGWYDLTVRTDGDSRWLRRLAGRLETGVDSISDPAMAGPAIMKQAFLS
jgi:phospholipase C